MELTLEDAILKSIVVEEAGLKEFPGMDDRIEKGEYEIHCIVWDEETETPYHAFAWGDLKATSTLQLFELVPTKFDPIILMIECAETIEVNEDEEDI